LKICDPFFFLDTIFPQADLHPMAKSYNEKDIEATAHDPTDHGIGEIKDLKIDKNQDAALEFLRGGGDVRPMSAADEKALLRKIDWRIMVSYLHISA
jgi:hypothetical protein